MAEVDDFLEELAADLVNSQKEVSTLKAKMKVLVDKIEEYRNNESALNQSILSAQKLAQQIESDARAKADKMIAEAEAKAAETLGSITEKKAFEENRLAAAQAASAKFIEGIRAMCNVQLKNIEGIAGAVLPASDKTAAAKSPEKAPAAEAAPAAKPVEKSYSAPADSKKVDAAVRKIDAAVAEKIDAPEVKVDINLDSVKQNRAPAKGFDSTQPFSL